MRAGALDRAGLDASARRGAGTAPGEAVAISDAVRGQPDRAGVRRRVAARRAGAASASMSAPGRVGQRRRDSTRQRLAW